MSLLVYITVGIDLSALWVCLRYWLFSDVVPGLYIEKGWVHDSIDYSYTLPLEEATAEPEDEEATKEETNGKLVHCHHS